MSSVTEFATSPLPSAVRDEAHIGHINGALGTIRHDDVAPRTGWVAKLRTLLAIPSKLQKTSTSEKRSKRRKLPVVAVLARIVTLATNGA